MSDKNKLTIRKTDNEHWIILVVIFGFFIFAGEPDLHDKFHKLVDIKLEKEHDKTN